MLTPAPTALVAALRQLETDINREARALVLVDLPAIRSAWHRCDFMDLPEIEAYIRESLESSREHSLAPLLRRIAGA